MVDWENLPTVSRLRSGGQTLSVRRMGRGPRLVLLHGGPGLDHHVMLPLAAELADRFDVWLPDLPGHGGHHPSGQGLPDLASILERTGRWLAGLDPPAAVLGGHSLGAWLVREMLRSGRLRPRAALLLSPPAHSPDRLGAKASRPATPRRPRPVRGEGRTLRAAFLEFCTEDMEGPASVDFVESIRRSSLRPPELYVALHGQLRRSLEARPGAFRPPCPVLLLSGELDAVCPPEAAALLAGATEGARATVVTGAGHVPWAADPAPVAATILEILETCGIGVGGATD